MEPLRIAGTIAVFIITYIHIRSPLDDNIQVLISLGISFFVVWFVIATYGQIKAIRTSSPAPLWQATLNASLIQIALLIALVHLIFPFLIYLLIQIITGMVRPAEYEKIEKDFAENVVKFMQQTEMDKMRFQVTTQGISGVLVLTSLTIAYWIIGIPQIMQFIQFSIYIFIGYFLFALIFANMRKPKAAQIRWINPFAIAGSFVIIFTLYVAILRGQSELQIFPYLATIALFLILLWYFSYLSRREVTIEEGKDATGSQDRDLQMDTANMTMSWYFQILVRLQPIFLAIGLAQVTPEVVADMGGPMLYSWLQALLVTVAVILVMSIIFMVIWARNIRKPELVYEEDGKILKIAGTEGRDKYPTYRDQLAASALPYCVFIPAMVFALLTILGQSPQSITGISGVWFDILLYGLLAIILFGLLVQVPYRSGQMARLQPELKKLQKLEEKIEKGIIGNYNRSQQNPNAELQIIAGEMTLSRLKESRRQLKGQFVYKFNFLGETISSTDALSSVFGVIVTAIATGAGIVINLLLGVPAS